MALICQRSVFSKSCISDSSDTTAPTFSAVPGRGCRNVTVPCEATGNTSALLSATLQVDDNVDCSRAVAYPVGPYVYGSTPVAIAVSDASGNTATCTATVTVTDPFPPLITCPQATVLVAQPGRATADFTCVAADGVSFNASVCSNGAVWDNVGIARITQSVRVVAVGTTNVQFTAVDWASNTAACMVTVTVLDQEPPILVCPPSVAVPESATSLMSWFEQSVSATDNYAVQTFQLTADSAAVFNVGAPFTALPLPLGWTVVPGDIAGTTVFLANKLTLNVTSGATVVFTLSAADTSNNTARCNFSITVTRSAITSSLLAASNLTGTALTAAFVNITRSSANMSSLQASLSADIAVILVNVSIQKTDNVSVGDVFRALDQLGQLSPAALASSQALTGAATIIRGAIGTFVKSLVSDNEVWVFVFVWL